MLFQTNATQSVLLPQSLKIQEYSASAFEHLEVVSNVIYTASVIEMLVSCHSAIRAVPMGMHVHEQIPQVTMPGVNELQQKDDLVPGSTASPRKSDFWVVGLMPEDLES